MSIRWIHPTIRRRVDRLSRRTFLRSAGAGLLVACTPHGDSAPRGDGAAPAPSVTGDHAPRAAAPPPPENRAFLSAEGWTLMAAISERVLPSDDGPGAREAGVVRFIDRQLVSKELAGIGDQVKELVAAFEAWGRKHGTPFHRLPTAEQDRALSALARGGLDLDVDAGSQADLFEFVHTLTLEGFLSDPAYGGNEGGVGWRAIGFDQIALQHAHGAGHDHAGGR